MDPLAGSNAVAVAEDGRIYICDSWNRRLVALDQDEKPLGALGPDVNGVGDFQDMYDVKIGPGGTIWVSDLMILGTQVFDASGMPVALEMRVRAGLILRSQPRMAERGVADVPVPF
jgi:hypothetical protein